jgi:hypothetical protein
MKKKYMISTLIEAIILIIIIWQMIIMRIEIGYHRKFIQDNFTILSSHITIYDYHKLLYHDDGKEYYLEIEEKPTKENCSCMKCHNNLGK